MLVNFIFDCIMCILEYYELDLKNYVMYLPIGETFVTRKITRAVAKIHLGQQDEVS